MIKHWSVKKHHSQFVVHDVSLIAMSSIFVFMPNKFTRVSFFTIDKTSYKYFSNKCNRKISILFTTFYDRHFNCFQRTFYAYQRNWIYRILFTIKWIKKEREKQCVLYMYICIHKREHSQNIWQLKDSMTFLRFIE